MVGQMLVDLPSDVCLILLSTCSLVTLLCFDVLMCRFDGCLCYEQVKTKQPSNTICFDVGRVN